MHLEADCGKMYNSKGSFSHLCGVAMPFEDGLTRREELICMGCANVC